MKPLKPEITRNRLGEPFPGECQKSYCDYHDLNMEYFCSMGEEPMFATAGHGCPSYNDVLKRANLDELQKATLRAIGKGCVWKRNISIQYERQRYGLEKLRPTLMWGRNLEIIGEEICSTGILIFLTEKGLEILEQLEAENEM